MFESAWMDRFTRVHPMVVPALFVPIILGFAWLALDDGLGVSALAGWVLLGYVVWTFTEYWLHRVVFHFEPEGGIGARLHWMMHGVHHDHPNDPLRLVMPPSASLPLGALFVAALPGAAGVRRRVRAERRVLRRLPRLRHDALRRAPPSAQGPGLDRKLRELHMRHHFQDDTTGFGVSAPWWDVVFRTTPPKARRR